MLESLNSLNSARRCVLFISCEILVPTSLESTRWMSEVVEMPSVRFTCMYLPIAFGTA